jgi:hypothetical protein
MYFDTVSARETATPFGSNELAEGVMLLRASTLKLIRLQLAIERHDRQVALEAVDDLVALDRKLQDCLKGAPTKGNGLMFRRELDSDRAALNEEKLTLGAEVLRRPPNGAEQANAKEEADPVGNDDDWLGPPDLAFEPEEPQRTRWWLAIVPIVMAAAAATSAYFVGIPDAAAWFAEAAGAVR